MSGLHSHRAAITRTLSTGWKQRLALGCAVLHEPPIIFLDEPTSGVDPISRRQFWNLIYDMSNRGITVFVTTHYMDEAEYCDELVLIYRGIVIAHGRPEQLKQEQMRESIIDVRCDHPQDAMELIESLEEVQETALFGRGLHVVTQHPDAAMPVIRQSLQDNHFTVRRIEEIVPSLEDVFVSLVEAHDRTNGQAKEYRA